MKRIAVKLTVITMIMILMAALGISAALAETTYNVWVGGIQVTESNKGNILGNGTASYDPSTQTLTLNNANITTQCSTYGGIITAKDHSLTVTGTATLSSNETNAAGIKVLRGILTLKNANIQVNISDTGYVIYSNGDWINGSAYYSQGGIIIEDSVVKTVGGSRGFFLDEDRSTASISLRNCTVSVTDAKDKAIYSRCNISIENSNVTASADGNGIRSQKDMTISGSEVIATAKVNGIHADGTLTIKNDIVSVSATCTSGLSAMTGKTITLGDQLIIDTPAGGSVGSGQGELSSEQVVLDGTSMAKDVLIAPAGTLYPVWVGSTRVTENNRNDILGDGGKAKYNPSDHTLTLNNPSVSGTYKGAAIYADGDLTVSGSLSVTGTKYGILTTGSCAIIGGSLDISATDDSNSYGISALEITISGGTVKAGAKTVGIHSLKKTVISGGTVTATAPNGTGIASPDLNISGGTVTAEGASSGMSAGTSPSSASFTGGTIKAIGSGVTGMPGMASGIAFDTVEIGNGITSLTADGDFCAIGGTTITIGSDLMIKEPENGKVAEQSGAYFVMKDDGTTIATHALIVPMGTYEITTKHVPAGGGGFVMTAGPYYEGKQVQIILNIFSGYDLDKMTVQDAHGNDIPVVSNEFIMPASDVTVTAYYKTDDGEYFITVTDDGNGTASASAATAAPGEEVTLSATPNAGYRFKEWQVVSGGITVTDNKFIMGSENVEIKAIFEEIPASVTYTVTFDANGHGTAPAAQTVEAGKAAAKPSDPAETGWIFDGWYREAACINAFDFSTLITDDITLYAKWTEEGITPAKITYMVTGGGNSTWIKDSNSNVIITVKRSEADETCFSHFSGVRIDGTTLAAGDYEARSGSTVITLKAATLQKLSVGDHTVTISFDDGKAETKLTVKAASSTPTATPKPASSTPTATPKPTDVPKTGDSADFQLWLGLILLGLIGISVLGLTAIRYRK